MDKKRLFYIDNIRIFLTAIVIIHHLLISYGAPGGWYYREFEYSQLDIPTLTFLVLFTAVNQAYFMGFFFFLSGYFSSSSIQGKRTHQFLKQRLIRLGLPILLYVYFISPLLRLVYKKIMFQQPFNLDNILSIYSQLKFKYELGPMWFVLLLLILSIIFLPFLKIDILGGRSTGMPTDFQIITFALVTGILTFIVRIFLPVGSVYQPLNLQLPHTVQYVSMYLIGSLAYHNDWLLKIKQIFSSFWIILFLGLLLIMPLIFILSGGLEGDVAPALGGVHWQSLAYSIWEQIFCVSMIIILLYYFQKFADSSNSFTSELAASSYSAYIIHPLVLVIFTTLIHTVQLHPLLKICISLIPVLTLCFLAAGILRRIPGLNRVL